MTKLINKIIYVNMRRTSMRLCCSEWSSLDEICAHENISRNRLIEIIEDNKDEELGLTYSTRLFIIMYYRDAAKLKNNKKPDHPSTNASDAIMNVIKKISVRKN